ENEAAYDIYKTTVSTTIGGSSIKTVERTQFWIVNQVNQMPEKADTEFTAAHDIIAFLNKLTQYGMDTVAIRVIGICAEVQDGAGTVTFTENTPRFGSIGTSAVAEKQQTDDGYFWICSTSDVSHETKLEYEKDGRFNAFWDQAEDDRFVCGTTDTEFILHDEKPIRYQYSAEINSTGGIAVGVYCELTAPNAEVFIIDGIAGNLPDGFKKISTETIEDNTYDIYSTKTTNASYGSGSYWFVNQKNQLAESGVGTVSGDHNITAVLRTLEGYGQFIGEVESVAAMLRATYDGSGSATFTENFCGEPKNTEPEQQTAVKDIFGRLLTVGKEIIADDLPSADQPDQKSYLLENYEIASMEDLIMPSMYLKGDWKPGEPLEVDFTLFHNYLKFCEENQIPVVIGPFVAPRSLPTLEYYKDETGKYLAPEKMNERFEEIIKLTFNALKESYPDLKISGAIVSSQILADPLIGNSRNSIQLVYGKDNFDFLPEIYASARKYAPYITALYMEEDFSTELGFIDDFAAVADNIRKENDCIDGTALTVSVYEPDSWTEAVSKSFCTAVTKLDKLDMKLILSDVVVTCRTPYNDTMRSAGYQILFRDILSVHDKIDAVLLSDCTQYLDGAHPLANTRGFTEALSSAASKYGKQEPSATKNGDVNCDDAIDVSDAVLLARYVTEDRSAQINDQGRANADADGNGKVEADDVIHILRIIAKLI
ncbi:MAG: dockerin type I repeat-containing protein, partial [Oscillospiraceae bacterium]|nr:dockerin type I repeat-containing protein [Oscillospiraceae bacterium]